ncbi:MAG: prepilin-type N-terminal cleavage/methylation domain-containing protein [Deltaproteobacteria bacterium]|nr:prepilin-type N-terminal cleavage/methylation domain-containing protein [Deltaproteobacteria bacterium]
MMAPKKNPGFTLVELLVAISISAVIMTAVYAAYNSQQNSYVVQEEVAALQQNLRAAMFYMSNQIREAGCNPTQTDVNRPGLVTADVDKINFTADITGPTGRPDGKTDDSYENITYSLYTADGIQKLGVRSTAGATNQPVIENVDALNFVYLDSGTPPAPTTVLLNIRSIEITIVVRASREDTKYIDNNQYVNQQGDVVLAAQNDHFRRKMLSMRIACRNLGL